MSVSDRPVGQARSLRAFSESVVSLRTNGCALFSLPSVWCCEDGYRKDALMEAATATAPAHLAGPGTALNRLRPDRRLAERFRAGDENAFAVLHERHRHRLLAICIGVLGSYEDAQDALQNALVNAAAGLRRRTPDDPRAGLARVAGNAAIDLARTRRPVVALYDEAPERGGGPAARVQEREDMAQLVASLRRLPEHQRTALVMRELAGSSYAEVA